MINQIDHSGILHIVRLVLNTPGKQVWSSYDEQADVLYINIRKPSIAADSKLTEDDIIIRYDGDEVIGLTVLHARERTQ
jgi:uncharacterized protein YuzE